MHMIRIMDVADDGTETLDAECTLAEMLEANSEDEELVAIVTGLEVGQSADLGGGAAPHVRIYLLDGVSC